MRSLETYINETEMIDVNPSQSGLGRLLRKILKAVIGDYEYSKYDPRSYDFDKDEADEFIEKNRQDIKHEKPEIITDKSTVMKALKEKSTFKSFTYLSLDYEKNAKRYDDVSGLISLPISLDEFGKGVPYIVALYLIEKKTINFKCVEIWSLTDDEKKNVTQLFSLMKKCASANKCEKMKITLLSKTDKKEECSYPLFKKMISKENEAETSNGEGGMYYYTYTLDVNKSSFSNNDNETKEGEEK